MMTAIIITFFGGIDLSLCWWKAKLKIRQEYDGKTSREKKIASISTALFFVTLIGIIFLLINALR